MDSAARFNRNWRRRRGIAPGGDTLGPGGVAGARIPPCASGLNLTIAMTEFTTSLQPRSPRRASWPVLFVLPAMAASILWALPNGPAEPPAGRAPFAQAPWVRTELYFGMTCPDGSRVSDDEWRAFLDA